MIQWISGYSLATTPRTYVFHAQQAIPFEDQLALTNGGYWTVRRDGPQGPNGWDWEIVVKAWGCAEHGTL